MGIPIDRGKPVPIRIKQRHVTAIHESGDGLETVEYVIGGRRSRDRIYHRHDQGASRIRASNQSSMGLAITFPSDDINTENSLTDIGISDLQSPVYTSARTMPLVRFPMANNDNSNHLLRLNQGRDEDQSLFLQFWRYIFRSEDSNDSSPFPRNSLQRWRVATRPDSESSSNSTQTRTRNRPYNWTVRPLINSGNEHDAETVDDSTHNDFNNHSNFTHGIQECFSETIDSRSFYLNNHDLDTTQHHTESDNSSYISYSTQIENPNMNRFHRRSAITSVPVDIHNNNQNGNINQDINEYFSFIDR